MDNSSYPLVSVIIPTYNAAEYIEESIRSALSQTERNFELLVFDNASLDNTKEVVESIHDERIKFQRNERNIGFAGNANLGLRKAKGKYLCYLGADDIWEETFLENMLLLMEANRSMSFSHGSAIWIDEHGNQYGGMSGGWENVTKGEKAFLDCFDRGFCFSTLMMRTDIVKRIGPLDESWKEIADTWLFLKLCLEGDVGYLDKPLVRYRVHQKSLSLNLYKDGVLFKQHFNAAKEAFQWKKARRLGLHREMKKGLRSIAVESISILQIVRRDGTRRQYLEILWDIVRESPTSLFVPKVWLRIAFSMLPRPLIIYLSNAKKSRWRKSKIGPIPQ